MADEVYIFQQNNALAHCVRQSVELLRRERPKLTAPDMAAQQPGKKPVD